MYFIKVRNEDELKEILNLLNDKSIIWYNSQELLKGETFEKIRLKAYKQEVFYIFFSFKIKQAIAAGLDFVLKEDKRINIIDLKLL